MIIYPAKYWIDDKVLFNNLSTVITEVSISNGVAKYKMKGVKGLKNESDIELIEHDASYFENAKFTIE